MNADYPEVKYKTTTTKEHPIRPLTRFCVYLDLYLKEGDVGSENNLLPPH
jgi:hypothetical protein